VPAKQTTRSRSKRRFAASLTGALILFGLLVYGLVLGHVELVVDHIEPIVGFLGTGPGVLLSVIVAVLFLWTSRAGQPKSKPDQAALSSRFDRERQRLKSALQEDKRGRKRLKLALREGERELERLKAELREGERERERLKVELREGEREQERLRAEQLEGAGELERLREDLRKCLQEHERERERLNSEIEQLGAERYALKEKVTTYESRVTLKQALNAAYVDGFHLRGRTSSHRRRTSRGRKPNDEAAAKWAIRTSELIKEALGEGEARHFLGASQFRPGDSSLAKEHMQLDAHLKQLAALIERVDSLQPLELRAGFKEQELVSSR
jgi:chromosome segregation ATPase